MVNYLSSAWGSFNPSYNDTPRVSAGTGKRTRPNSSARMAVPDVVETPTPRPIATITLASTTTTNVSDADIGLGRSATSQEAAEAFVKAALAYRAKQAATATQSEMEAAAMVELARKSRDAKAERLKLIREVAERFTANR